jgi:uncharacterized membrane protein YkvA (DUF1232 family)
LLLLSSTLLIAVLAALALYAGVVVLLVARGRRTEARALAGFVPDCVALFRRLLRAGAVPGRAKLVLVALVAYLAMPLDLIPDFIPVAGQLDDAILVALALRYLLGQVGIGPIREHWPGPEASLELVLRLAGRRKAAVGAPSQPRP